MRSVVLAFLVGLGLATPLAAELEASPVSINSFANAPRILGGSLERAQSGLLVRLEAQFSNEFYAQTGAEAYYFDRPLSRKDKPGALRVLWLKQKINPAGNPDIDRPVTKQIVIELPSAEKIETITILNVDQAFEDRGDNPRSHSFVVAEVHPAESKPTDMKIKATPMATDRRLPPVSNVSLKRKPDVGGAFRYTVEFDVEVPAGTLRAEDVSTEIDKQSLGGDLPAVADWWFISVPLRAAGEGVAGGQGGQAQRLHCRVSTEVPSRPNRIVVIGNFVTDRKASDQGPFQVLRVR